VKSEWGAMQQLLTLNDDSDSLAGIDREANRQ
jgi:hypothetical protein